MTHVILPKHLLPHVIEALVAMGIAVVVARVLGRIIGLAENRHVQIRPDLAGRRSTLYRLLTSAIRYVVGFMALLTILDIFGVPTTSLLAGAGVFGLAISFGAQGLVQDIVTGFFLLYEDQYAVGDQITLPALSLSGTVVELGIRVTRLKGLTGELVSVPNRLILEVQNHARGQTTVSVTVPVAPSEDPDRVERVFQEAMQEMAHEIPAATVAGITAFQLGQVVWTLSAPAGYQDAYRVGLALHRAAARAVHRHHIELAGGLKGAFNGQAPV